ncbi:hypothetical protein ACNKHN_09340 [Shigella flexneri]
MSKRLKNQQLSHILCFFKSARGEYRKQIKERIPFQKCFYSNFLGAIIGISLHLVPGARAVKPLSNGIILLVTVMLIYLKLVAVPLISFQFFQRLISWRISMVLANII